MESGDEGVLVEGVAILEEAWQLEGGLLEKGQVEALCWREVGGVESDGDRDELGVDVCPPATWRHGVVRRGGHGW